METTRIKNKRLKKYLENADHLPSLPTVCTKIIQITSNPDFELKDLANIIKADAVFTSKILRIVNSAYFSLPHEIKNIEQAISMLGADSIRNLAITFSLFEIFPTNSADLYETLFKKALCAGIVSNFICEIEQIAEKDELFLAGMLQHIGAFVLTYIIPENYISLNEETRRRGLPVLFVEKAELGITHLEVGLLVAQKWHLPQIVPEVIRYRILRDLYFFKDSSQEIKQKLEIARLGSIAADIYFGFHRAFSIALFKQNLIYISDQMNDQVTEDLLSSVPQLMKNIYDQYGLDFTGRITYEDIIRQAEQELIQVSYRNVRTYFEMKKLKNQLATQPQQ